MEEMIILMGLPGSGKTFYSNSLEGTKLNMDEIRRSVTGSYKMSPSTNKLFFNVALNSAQFYLKKGERIILDGPFLSVASRKPYIEMAKKHNARVTLYWFDPSLSWLTNKVIERNEWVEEDRKVSITYIEQLAKNNLEIPTMDEGIDNINYLTEDDLFY